MLNQVQQDFVNVAARQHMETLIKALHDLDTFVADYDALQASANALPEDATVLDDAGASPRADAPELTGTNLKALRDFSANMSAIVTDPAKQILVSLMVRSLNNVLRV